MEVRKLPKIVIDFSLKGKFSGHVDKQDKKIYYETSKLKLPDGRIAKLMFDYGTLTAYYAYWENNAWIDDLDGVNNVNSFYLRDCEIIN